MRECIFASIFDFPVTQRVSRGFDLNDLIIQRNVS
jgi:hypothetical protein